MNQLYIAWQDEETRRWFPVGMLTHYLNRYQFVYLRGAVLAAQTGLFFPFPSFPDLHAVYEDTDLFPLFANRVMPRSRREFKEYIEWLSISEAEADPMTLLMRSGGRSATDSLEMYTCPQRMDDGSYHIRFFMHGVRYMSSEAIECISTLQYGTRLLLMHDLQNPHDPKALIFRTDGEHPGDKQMVGYCPRYLTAHLHEFLSSSHDLTDDVIATVERVNLSPAPIQLRLLCNLSMRWSDAFKPYDGEEYKQLKHIVHTLQLS